MEKICMNSHQTVRGGYLWVVGWEGFHFSIVCLCHI